MTRVDFKIDTSIDFKTISILKQIYLILNYNPEDNVFLNYIFHEVFRLYMRVL